MTFTNKGVRQYAIEHFQFTQFIFDGIKLLCFFNTNLTFSICFKVILKTLTQKSVLLKGKFHYYSLLKGIINLSSFFGGKNILGFQYVNILFHIFKMYSWNTHKSKVYCDKETQLLFSPIEHLQFKKPLHWIIMQCRPRWWIVFNLCLFKGGFLLLPMKDFQRSKLKYKFYFWSSKVPADKIFETSKVSQKIFEWINVDICVDTFAATFEDTKVTNDSLSRSRWLHWRKILNFIYSFW